MRKACFKPLGDGNSNSKTYKRRVMGKGKEEKFGNVLREKVSKGDEKEIRVRLLHPFLKKN